MPYISKRHGKLVGSGKFIVHTEAQTLDDALKIVAAKQRVRKRQTDSDGNVLYRSALSACRAGRGLAAGTASLRKRALNRKKRTPPVILTLNERVEWARRLYSTGWWNLKDLCSHFGVAKHETMARWVAGVIRPARPIQEPIVPPPKQPRLEGES